MEEDGGDGLILQETAKTVHTLAECTIWHRRRMGIWVSGWHEIVVCTCTETEQAILDIQVMFLGIGALSDDGSGRPDVSVSLKLTSLGTFWLVEYRAPLLGPPCSLLRLRLEEPSFSSSSEASRWRRCRSCRSMDALSSSKSSSRSSPSAVS